MRNPALRHIRPLRRFANADAPADDGLTPTLNAVAMPEGDEPPEWLSVPYADVPYNVNGVVGVQRLNLAVAQRLVALMERAMRIDPRLSGGMPFYRNGHPDFVDTKNAADYARFLQNQPEAVGWIREFEAAPNALRLRVEWNGIGADLIRRKVFKNWSPFFRSERMAVETVNGEAVQIFEPRLVQSAGLTNTPNWPMPPMVNAAILNGGTESGAMTLLQRLIALLGDTNIADDDAVVAAVQRLIDAAKKLKDSVDARWKAEDAARAALPNAADPFALLDGYLAHSDGLLAQANAAAQRADALEGRLKAALASHALDLVNAAVARGAVLQEHAAGRIEDLVNAGDAFADKARELAALPKLMKTESVTADAAPRVTQVADRRARFQELVNAALPDHKGDYDRAFAATAKKHPELLSGSPSENQG